MRTAGVCVPRRRRRCCRRRMAEPMTTATAPAMSCTSRSAPRWSGADVLAGLGLAGPALLLLLALFLLPTLSIFVIAATDWQFGAQTLAFVGLDNFSALFAETRRTRPASVRTH